MAGNPEFMGLVLAPPDGFCLQPEGQEGVTVLWEQLFEILMLENSFVIVLFMSKLQE